MKTFVTLLCFLLCGMLTAYGQNNQLHADRATLEKQARAGNAEASFYLGSCYHWGKKSYFGEIGETTSDYDKAVYWYTKSAELGYSPGCYALGVLYENQKKDRAQAIVWYKKAADMGSKSALESLKKMGIDYTPNIAQGDSDSKEALQRLAQAGNAEAQFKLGYCYYWGKLSYEGENDQTPHDYDQAEMWFLKSTENGCADAYFYLGLLYQYDKPDREKAIMWYTKEADATGNETAIKSIAELGGTYTPNSGGNSGADTEDPDSREALLAAAKAGVPRAQFRLGSCYHYGKKGYNGEVGEMPRDYDEAERWYLAAAKQGYTSSYFSLGLFYRNAKPDKAKSVEWLKKAADAGIDLAVNELKEMGIDYKAENSGDAGGHDSSSDGKTL